MSSSGWSGRWGWVAVCTLLAAIAAWNLWQLRGHRVIAEELRLEVGRARAEAAEVVGSMSRAHQVELALLGRTLDWPDGLEALPGAPEAAPLYAGHRLVMYFSELACNVCREREAQFMNGLAGITGGAGLAIVVHAENRRYARNFVRFGHLEEIPVYFDPQREMGRRNSVEESPVLVLLDAEDRVVAAHLPLPGHPGWSEPFHGAVSRLLGLL